MTQQELQELSNKLTTLSNSIIVDTNLYLANKTENRKQCLFDNFKNIETTLDEFKKITNI